MRLRHGAIVAIGTAIVAAAVPYAASAGTTQAGANTERVCAKPGQAGQMSCFAVRRKDVIRRQGFSPRITPAGYGPADLQSAYRLPVGNPGATVAIVDAYDDPTAESDLAVYRSQFGLSACTTANGCFKKVNQSGGTSYPSANTGWAEEISLDLDMVSAICPNCHILLVEASSASFANLAAAVDEAAALGANAISNSYGGGEYSNEGNDQSHYNHPGIAVTVSSGDGGYGVEFPAASQYVTAVGGTSLTRSGNTRGWAESVWSGAGSGCSAYIARPLWQADSGCTNRTVADV